MTVEKHRSEPIDFADLPDLPRWNPEWMPPLQEMIYEALCYASKDGSDQDGDCGEQMAERLLIHLRNAHEEAEEAIVLLREAYAILHRNGDFTPKRIADFLRSHGGV